MSLVNTDTYFSGFIIEIPKRSLHIMNIHNTFHRELPLIVVCRWRNRGVKTIYN
ncbi:unnamed protein product [Brassica rapa subsp. trilocularis]